MAFSHKKKLLTLSAFVALSFSQGALGGEACLNQLNDNGNGTQTLTRLNSTTEITETTKDSIRKTLDTTVEDMQAKERAQKEHAEQQRTREFLGIGPDYQPSLWDIPSMFVKSLFQPFIEDAAPKVAAAVRQGIEKEGVARYVLNTTGKVVTTIIENPLESIILGSAFALGYADLGDYTSTVQIAASTAGKVKNGVLPLVKIGTSHVPMMIYALKEEGSKLEQDGSTLTGEKIVNAVAEFVQSETFWTMAKVGAAYYLLSSIPGAEAQYTPVLGTEYKINQNSILTSTSYSSAGLQDGSVGTVWQNSAKNLVGRIHFPNNGTFVAGEFQINTNALAAQVTPTAAALAGGNWFASWQDGTSMLVRIMTPTGSFVTSPFQVNTVISTAQGGLTGTGLAAGRGLVAWGNSSAVGGYDNCLATFAGDGTGLTAPSILAHSSTAIGYPLVTSLPNGNGYADWGGSGSVLGTEISPTGTPIGTPASISVTSPPFVSGAITGLTGGTGADAIDLYQQSKALIGRSIQGGVPTGSEFIVRNSSSTFCCSSVAGTGGNALAVWQVPVVLSGTNSVNGTLISPTGTILSGEFYVPTNTNVNGVGSPVVTSIQNGGVFATYGDATTGIFGREVSFTTPPTSSPTIAPTQAPLGTPTSTPTTVPLGTPTSTPTTVPLGTPTSTPTTVPLGTPTSAPTSAADSLSPSSVLMGGVFALASLFLG